MNTHFERKDSQKTRKSQEAMKAYMYTSSLHQTYRFLLNL